jgi:cyanophycin synthetase
MNIRQLRVLLGPNRWAACPVLEVTLDLDDSASYPSHPIRQTLEQLGATAEADAAPLSDPARAFAWAGLQLQNLAGTPVSFTAVRPSSQPGRFLAAVEFAEEPVGRAAVETAARLLRSAREGKALSLEEDLRRLKDLEYQCRPPASTATIYNAARARGIPVSRLIPEYRRPLRLGQGSKQHRCVASEPDTVSAVARYASTDKHLAKHLLRCAGVPVPEGRLVSSAEQAWAAASELGLPVAVKPVDQDLGTGVSLDLHSREQVEDAFRAASEHSHQILVERFAPGIEHRVLVVGDRVVAVSKIDPPLVVGDGVSSIAELVEKVNRDPRRGDEGSGAPKGKLKLDDVAVAVLAGQGCTPASIPRAGERILVRRNPPYIVNGGNLVDLTDQIHPSTAAHAVAAAGALQIPVAGLDVVAADITRPLEEQGGVVVEINVSPGLWLHLAPWADSPRPVGDAIVASLFPPGSDGRIPVAAIVGDATAAAGKHLAALLAVAGLRAGCAGEAEITLGNRTWPARSTSPQERAGLVLQNPTVDVALLQTGPAELLRAGFGNDHCDVAILLGPAGAAAAVDADAQPGDVVAALRHALVPQGVLVLEAEAEAAGIESTFQAEQFFLVAGRDSPAVRGHLGAGGRALVVQGDALVLARGTEPPTALGKCPGSVTEPEVPGFLAALAAGLVLGQDISTLQAYLRSVP